METLAQIPLIKAKLKTASKKTIQALHKLVFMEDGDRGNRHRLREFNGFKFHEDSEEFCEKLVHASRLTMGDLISICNVLGLDYAGSSVQLREKIVRSLMDINALGTANMEGEAESANDDDEEGENRNDDDNNRERINGDNNNNGEEENGNDVNSEGSVSDDDDDDDAASRTTSHANSNNSRAGFTDRGRRRPTDSVKFTLSYRDVEDTIRTYDGTSNYPIEQWIVDFDDTATMFGWDSLKKFIFAKKSLRSLARIFIQSERSIKAWNKLK